MSARAWDRRRRRQRTARALADLFETIFGRAEGGLDSAELEAWAWRALRNRPMRRSFRAYPLPRAPWDHEYWAEAGT